MDTTPAGPPDDVAPDLAYDADDTGEVDEVDEVDEDVTGGLPGGEVGPWAGGTEAGTGPSGPDAGPDPLRFSRWMHRTATGAVMLGFARGLDEALAVRRRPPAFVVETDGRGDDDGPIHLELDPDDPTKAVAVIRPPAVPPAGDGD